MRSFLDSAFEHVGLQWRDHVIHDTKYLRPTEVKTLVGNAMKAKRILGWETQVNVKTLAQLMVDADLKQITKTRDAHFETRQQ